MDELISYIGRLLSGPGHLRFLIQPLMAIWLGLRDGRRDAKLGRAPYVWVLVLGLEQRRSDLVRQGLASIAVPLVIAIILDGVAQYLIFGHIRILAAVAIGALLIAVPYAGSRGIGNRMARRKQAGSPGGRRPAPRLPRPPRRREQAPPPAHRDRS